MTYDYGVARIRDETEDGIDTGTLKQIIMVDYGLLKPVLMNVSWVKQVVDGRRTVKKDRHGFWTCKLNEREDPTIHNPYVYPKLVTQVFFMSDKSSRDWKVILSHEPRSKRIIGEKEQQVFEATGASVYAEGMVPGIERRRHHARTEPNMSDLEVPLQQYHIINTEMQAQPNEDAIYDDDQYEDEHFAIEHHRPL